MYYIETQVGDDPFVTREVGYSKQCEAEVALKEVKQFYRDIHGVRYRIRYIDFAQFLRDCIDLARWDYLSVDL